jgi:hypothetical protein
MAIATICDLNSTLNVNNYAIAQSQRRKHARVKDHLWRCILQLLAVSKKRDIAP